MQLRMKLADKSQQADAFVLELEVWNFAYLHSPIPASKFLPYLQFGIV